MFGNATQSLPLREDLLGCEGESLVEILAEDGGQGLAEELVNVGALAVAFLVGVLAYFPTM